MSFERSLTPKRIYCMILFLFSCGGGCELTRKELPEALATFYLLTGFQAVQLYVFANSLNMHLQLMHFIVCEFYLKKRTNCGNNKFYQRNMTVKNYKCETVLNKKNKLSNFWKKVHNLSQVYEETE